MVDPRIHNLIPESHHQLKLRARPLSNPNPKRIGKMASVTALEQITEEDPRPTSLEPEGLGSLGSGHPKLQAFQVW